MGTIEENDINKTNEYGLLVSIDAIIVAITAHTSIDSSNNICIFFMSLRLTPNPYLIIVEINNTMHEIANAYNICGGI